MVDSSSLRARVRGFDWARVKSNLDAHGYARLPGLLSSQECQELRDLYEERSRFRSFVDLGAKGYGDRGDYRYFAYPLPSLVRSLRTHFYRPLAEIANSWQAAFGRPERFPPSLRQYLKICHEAGQDRPTPLLLRYQTGGFNCLHQDVYGSLSFPLQVAALISRPRSASSGGEFLLTEHQARKQTREEALSLRMGEAIIFPNRLRPVSSHRGITTSMVRHGVSRVLSGQRMTLGLIFHDAE